MSGVLIIGLIVLVLLVAAILARRATYGEFPGWRPPERRGEWQGDYGGGFLVDDLFPWQVDRADQLAQGWARDNGYEIVASENRWFDGPFFWRSSDRQVVRYVTVRDQYGRERSGHVRLGGWFFGLWGDSTAVEWDEPEPRESWRR